MLSPSHLDPRCVASRGRRTFSLASSPASLCWCAAITSCQPALLGANPFRRQATIILSFTLGHEVGDIQIFFGVTIVMIAAPQIVLVRALFFGCHSQFALRSLRREVRWALLVKLFSRLTTNATTNARSSGSAMGTCTPSFAF